jgi:hypothetical protein
MVPADAAAVNENYTLSAAVVSDRRSSGRDPLRARTDQTMSGVVLSDTSARRMFP